MKTYVIHVSDAYEREKHINNQIKDKNLDCTFINKGDKKDLTQDVLDKYFIGEMHTISSGTSCAYKHILAYENILKNDEIALIIEDDISFYENFNKINEILTEIKNKKLENFIISIEDSILRYIPKSKRTKSDILYPEKMTRAAGAYLIDKTCAKNILSFIEKVKVNLPIDWFLNRCIDENLTNMFWSEPTLSIQGSLNGSIPSLIDNKKTGQFRILNFKIQRLYKKLLYNFR